MTQGNEKYSGTGNEIGRIPLGNGWHLTVEDDGSRDLDAKIHLFDENGNRVFTSGYVLAPYRSRFGDDELEHRLANTDYVDPAASQTSGDGFTQYSIGSFVCSDCGQTWPKRHNQTGDDPREADICPPCDGEDNPYA